MKKRQILKKYFDTIHLTLCFYCIIRYNTGRNDFIVLKIINRKLKFHLFVILKKFRKVKVPQFSKKKKNNNNN